MKVPNPLVPFYRIGWRVQKFINSKIGLDRYRAEDGTLIRGSGRDYRNRVRFDSIEKWLSEPEMVFDIVVLTLVDHMEIQWLDYYGDLLQLLRDNIPDKESY